jgi:hypothetical protein
VYAISDPALADEVERVATVWRPGVTSFSGLESLIADLRLDVLERDDFQVQSLAAAVDLGGDELHGRFRAALMRLEAALARDDPGLYGSLGVPWAEVRDARLYLDGSLALTARVEGRAPIRIDAEAHMLRAPLALVVRSEDVLGDSATAGAAIGSLFAGDRQKVAWAWAAMWERAATGAGRGVRLSSSELETIDATGIATLRGQVQARAGKGKRSGAKRGTGPVPLPKVAVRELKDLTTLGDPVETIVHAGESRSGVIAPPGPPADTRATLARVLRDSASKDGAAERTDDGAPRRSTTVLPPSDHREDLAYEVVQRALHLESDTMTDLRARRGVGADAVDELHQSFEIKMASGAASNQVKFTRAEAEAARHPGFFLAVVSGLEDPAVPLTVRFIADPLRRLAQVITGDVTLSGVNEVEALEVTFPKQEDG